MSAGTGSPDRGEGTMHAVSRRAFVAGGIAAGATLWRPVWRLDAADAASGLLSSAACAPPPRFPSGISLYQQAYQNWAQQITVDDLWTCAPTSPQEVVTVANWAAANGYKVRARGMMHGWSPLMVTPGNGCSELVVLLDTTQHLTSVGLVSSEPAAVRAQAGVTLDTLLQFLQERGLGFMAAPAPGDITVGGALAIDAHGTAVPAAGEELPAGKTYGSLSNLIVSLTAVVWSRSAGAYVLRTFDRSESDARAFLVHLGRTFITEVVMRAGADSNLRCQSFVDIPVSRLFAAPGAGGGGADSFASYLSESGRLEAIWYPFTDKPWLKVWSVSPTRPSASRAVTEPYNYLFSDRIPVEVSELATKLVNGDQDATPDFGAAQYDVTEAGLLATLSADIWGPSRTTLQYIKPTTLRATANGYSIQCRRADVQRVVSDFAAFYSPLLAGYAARGEYPINMPVEIRVTGRDEPGDVGISGAVTPILSALGAWPDHREWDTAVWIDVLTMPLTANSVTFYRQLERWIFSHYSTYAGVRPEWSKGWAYGTAAAWSDPTVIGTTIPAAYRTGRTAGTTWDRALATLDRYDPHRIFTNAFLDVLTPSTIRR